jgi:hypothetical protein
VLRAKRKDVLAVLKHLDDDISARVKMLSQDAKEADLAEAEATFLALKEKMLQKKQGAEPK